MLNSSFLFLSNISELRPVSVSPPFPATVEKLLFLMQEAQQKSGNLGVSPPQILLCRLGQVPTLSAL